MNRSLRHTREYIGNRYHLVRDCVQAQKPFVIYNFTNSKQYNEVLNDLDKYGKLPYVLQVLHSIDQGGGRVKRSFPSIFVTNDGSEVTNEAFKDMVKGSIKHYGLDSIVCLYDGGVSVFYKNGEHHEVGQTIYSSNIINEFNSDFYQIESAYYCFIA
jgi:hypothetical protein